ncbi:hypothetical protein EVAR_66938_1 [Eumeta japonica]|uniref:Uncharacterized protein n=1 Tax=Eumeta variegata TaxID=151549 RepID=A0A4C2A739_EUMVA|nr:hypothetical protein EVAR_66938_1 [Eumeta japonica]
MIHIYHQEEEIINHEVDKIPVVSSLTVSNDTKENFENSGMNKPYEALLAPFNDKPTLERKESEEEKEATKIAIQENSQRIDDEQTNSENKENEISKVVESKQPNRRNKNRHRFSQRILHH